MKKDDPIARLCWDWVRWCITRKYYFRAPSQSILARLQPSKAGGGQEPDAANGADLQFFNMAVYTLADMPAHQQNFAAFIAHYHGEGEVIKRVVDKLGISRSTYYKRVAQFGKDAYSMAQSLKRVHAQKCEPGHDTLLDCQPVPNTRHSHLD